MFHGNKTGDLVEKAIDGKSNIILTNACNWQQPTYLDWNEGAMDLEKLLDKYKPCKIICLGMVAANTVTQQLGNLMYSPKVEILAHPSYVIRFNLNPSTYTERLRQLVP